VNHYYFAITSTYRPLFLAFLGPFALGPTLSKSSILLAVLRLFGGWPAELVFDTDRIMTGGAGVNLPSEPSEGVAGGRPSVDGDDVREPLGGPAGPPGGALARPMPGADVGGGVEAAERGGPLGGGGVAPVFAAVSSAPPFLLIQRFWSGS